jgi:mannose-1-phosphate guanylyltransferase
MIISNTVIPKVLSCGLGKKLWEFSRPSFPKKLLSLLSDN